MILWRGLAAVPVRVVEVLALTLVRAAVRMVMVAAVQWQVFETPLLQQLPSGSCQRRHRRRTALSLCHCRPRCDYSEGRTTPSPPLAHTGSKICASDEQLSHRC